MHARSTLWLAILLMSAQAMGGCAAASRGASATAARPDSARVRRDIEYLASDALEGRGTGTPGNDSAAAFAARRFGSLGLRSFAPDYLQPFLARSAMLAHSSGLAAVQTQNIVAMLPGRDALLHGEFIVIGAHIDHLGRSTAGALDPEAGDAIRNGADDNASGTAAVWELARLFSVQPTRHSLIFVNFSGEELGLLGSQYFVDHAPISLDSVVAMINFDMVGRMRHDSVIVYGVRTATELPALLDSANVGVGLHVVGIGDGFGPSDQSSFYAKNISVLHFFTNLHEDYHRATDDADKINAAGEARVIALAERVVRELDRRDARLTFVRAAAPAPVPARTGSNVYLGSVPDMTAPDAKGLRLSGIRPGSPADSAGLRAGDVVVELGGKEVTDLQTYSDALYSHQPGEEVDIVVLRGAERVRLRVRLGRRG